MRIALVYDRVNKWGGAERVLLALHKVFPDAPLFTSVYHPHRAPWASVFRVHHSFLEKFPFASSLHEIYAPLMPLAFESFTFEDFDVVISVTSEAAKGILTTPKTLHICLCLTPTRYLWSGYEEYFRNRFFRIASAPFVSYLRVWDRIASARADYFIAISSAVQERIKKYYSRESEVIFPPVTFMPKYKRNYIKGVMHEDFYLVVSRLVAYKRLDIVIKAANQLSLPLVIVGEGHDSASYKSIAGKSVTFVGEVSDRELSSYYSSCKALIFPGIEDFGLVMVEAQSFGKPVIAFKGGGALDIIKEGKTGEFFDKQNIASLVQALEKFNNKRYNKLACVRNAERFSFGRFKKRILEFVEEKKSLMKSSK